MTITLVCNDNNKIQISKKLLSTHSEFFQFYFNTNEYLTSIDIPIPYNIMTLITNQIQNIPFNINLLTAENPSKTDLLNIIHVFMELDKYCKQYQFDESISKNIWISICIALNTMEN